MKIFSVQLPAVILSVTDTDSLVALALETCATIPPDGDTNTEINIHLHILFIVQLELPQLHSRVCLFKRMFEFNQVHLGPSLGVAHINYKNILRILGKEYITPKTDPN